MWYKFINVTYTSATSATLDTQLPYSNLYLLNLSYWENHVSLLLSCNCAWFFLALFILWINGKLQYFCVIQWEKEVQSGAVFKFHVKIACFENYYFNCSLSWWDVVFCISKNIRKIIFVQLKWNSDFEFIFLARNI